MSGTPSLLDFKRLERNPSMQSKMFSSPTITAKILRQETTCFQLRIKLYCALHRPIGYAIYYHWFVLTLIFFSLIVIIVYESIVEDSDPDKQAYKDTDLKICLDSSIAIILAIELMVRLWSTDCVLEYRGVKGTLVYLRDNWFMRCVDLFGIISFAAYAINELTTKRISLRLTLNLVQLIQIFQLYRLLQRVMKLMIETLQYQRQQIYIVMIFAISILTFTSFWIYLVERDRNDGIKTISDSLYLTFVTFATIGYGDIYPITILGKAIMLTCSVLGIIFFALPSNIFGTGLALKIEENQKRTTMLMKPAVRLLQTVLICYLCNTNHQSNTYWRDIQSRVGRDLTARDRACIRFIRVVLFLMARNRFKSMIGLQNDLTNEKNQKDFAKRIEFIEKDIISCVNGLNQLVNKKKQFDNTLDAILDKIKAAKNKPMSTEHH